MSMTKNDALIEVVLERFVNTRIPRILDIKEKVDKGELLSEIDIIFFTQVLKDTRDNQHLLKDNEDLKQVFARAMHLYKEITELALENENNQNV